MVDIIITTIIGNQQHYFAIICTIWWHCFYTTRSNDVFNDDWREMFDFQM